MNQLDGEEEAIMVTSRKLCGMVFLGVFIRASLTDVLNQIVF
jgi:hypothetical protein